MNVLYVNHTAEVSGAERSLLSLLAGLPAHVRPLVASPPGPLSRAVEGLGIPTTAITGTAGSLRLHPLHTPRALGELSLSALQVRRAARSHRADLVHANSIRSGLVLSLARLSMASVVHVRDCLPPGPLSTSTMRVLGASATTMLANSHYTATSVRALAPRAPLEVLYNPVDLRRFDPARIDRPAARAALGDFSPGALLLGVVGQLSPWKGQDTAIEALRLICAGGVDAHLLLVGSAKFIASATRFDNRRYVERLRTLIADAGLRGRVHWLGEREDVPEIMGALDVLLLPSWEEPFGRAVIEAMALGVPVLATDIGGPAEIIENGREGNLLAPGKPEAWAQAAARIAESPELGPRMGRAGRLRVERAFTVEHHVAGMLEIYKRAGVSF